MNKQYAVRFRPQYPYPIVSRLGDKKWTSHTSLNMRIIITSITLDDYYALYHTQYIQCDAITLTKILVLTGLYE